MRLHSLIFPPHLSFWKANILAKELVPSEHKVKQWIENDWVRIGYTFADKWHIYRSKKVKLKGLPITMVFETNSTL